MIRYQKGFVHVKGISERAARQVGAVWMKGSSSWRIPANTYSLRELYKVAPSEELAELGKQIKQREEEHLKKKHQDVETGDKRLRPYQKTDVQYLQQTGHAGIFNQQRTGEEND